jgi:uncharacterized membrane protein
MKGIQAFLMLLIALLAMTCVSAAENRTADEDYLDILKVELDGVDLDESGGNILEIDRGEVYEVEIKIEAIEDVEEVQIEAYLRGYDSSERVEAITDVFDLDAGRTKVKRLELKFPERLDKDLYRLRVRVEDKFGEGITKTYDIEVSSQRHDMRIKDVVYSPGNAVLAGRSLLAMIRLENSGSVDDDDGVKVAIEVPELGIEAADYIDELEEDDSVTSEELYLRIPSCTPGGVYEAIVTVTYNDGDDQESVVDEITVLEDDLCNVKETEKPVDNTPKTVITVGPTSQDVTAGEGSVIYPLTISNAGSDAKTYVITTDGYRDWATVSVSPSNILVLEPGEAKAVFVSLQANKDIAAGEHMFVVTVSSGAETLKQLTLKANVKAGEAEKPVSGSGFGSIRRVLEIGLVVLVVLLIILALIIGFSKLRGNDDNDDEDSKSETYY